MTPQTRPICENFANELVEQLRVGEHTGRTLCLAPLVGNTRIPFLRVKNKRRSKEETKEIDAIVERLRDYLRLKYVSYNETAKGMIPN